MKKIIIIIALMLLTCCPLFSINTYAEDNDMYLVTKYDAKAIKELEQYIKNLTGSTSLYFYVKNDSDYDVAELLQETYSKNKKVRMSIIEES